MGTGQKGTRKSAILHANAEIELQLLKNCEIAMQLPNCNAIVERFAL